MPKIMITCPKTQKPVDTGLALDNRSFESATFTNNSVNCPHCREKHPWNKADARLEDSSTI